METGENKIQKNDDVIRIASYSVSEYVRFETLSYENLHFSDFCFVNLPIPSSNVFARFTVTSIQIGALIAFKEYDFWFTAGKSKAGTISLKFCYHRL